MQYRYYRYNIIELVMSMYLKKLKDLREDHDYTQKYIASILNISQNSYSDIERGITNISVEFLIKLADLYEVSVDYILEREKR